MTRRLKARCTHITVTPLGIERSLAVAGATLTERLFVPRNLPAAVFEFECHAGAPAGDVRLRLEWMTHPGPASLRCQAPTSPADLAPAGMAGTASTPTP